jgi:hypothetical protein
MDVALERKRLALRKWVSEAHQLSIISECCANHLLSITNGDNVHGNRPFSAPLHTAENRIPPQDFRAWAIHWLNLGQPIKWGGAVRPGNDLQTDACKVGHGGEEKDVDECMTHAADCKASAGHRYEAHNNMTRTINRLARNAGAQTDYEITANKLLGNELQEETCTALFPAQASQALRARIIR